MSIECDMSRVPHSRGVQCGVLLESTFVGWAPPTISCRIKRMKNERSTERIVKDQTSGQRSTERKVKAIENPVR